jgi:hypothetical protein
LTSCEDGPSVSCTAAQWLSKTKQLMDNEQPNGESGVVQPFAFVDTIDPLKYSL